MPVSRNRKKHKSALAKRNKTQKLKKEKVDKLIKKYMAQIEQIKKNNLQNPLIGPVIAPENSIIGLIQEDNTIVEAEVVTTEEGLETAPNCLPGEEQMNNGQSK